jgi:succinyl-CoA synthetase beta subunit
VRFADSSDDAAKIAGELLASRVSGHAVESVLVEERVSIARELYAAVIHDARRRCPLILFSSSAGMDIEEVNSASPEQIVRQPVDIRRGLAGPEAVRVPAAMEADPLRHAVQSTVLELYRLYRKYDAELLEVNPLAITTAGEVVAVDCKLSIDDGAIARQPDIPRLPPQGTGLELRAREQGLLYIELDGDVGLLANGAGLAMATLDTVTFYGGRPANFIEIGGEAYRKAEEALSIVLANPRVTSLFVNFCGAFARTDVMAEGVATAWLKLQPDIPVAFSIHGTGAEAAVSLIRERLHVEPYEHMDDAARAAIRLAREGRRPRVGG